VGDKHSAVLKKVKGGDILLLKRGLSHFVAAGRAVKRNGVVCGNSDKDWLRDFDGWDLPAYCFVEWHVPKQPELARNLRTGTIYQTNREGHLSGETPPRCSCSRRLPRARTDLCRG
jgi:hypothetical protein